MRCGRLGAVSVLGVDSFPAPSIAQCASKTPRATAWREKAKFETANLFDWFTARKDERNSV